MVTSDFLGVPLFPDLRTSHRVHPLWREKNNSIVPVLEFADNVLLNLTPRAKGGELWEVTGWLGSMVLYFC